MTSQISDTDPKIAAIQMDLLRKASPARKLELAGQMYETVRTLALAGLRARFPEEDSEKIRRRLADLLLGQDLAKKVYGPFSGS